MEKITVILTKERVTKNFVLYSGGSEVENLYIRQDALSTPFPESVKITLEAA